jgi:hypothetical protein
LAGGAPFATPTFQERHELAAHAVGADGGADGADPARRGLAALARRVGEVVAELVNRRHLWCGT